MNPTDEKTALSEEEIIGRVWSDFCELEGLLRSASIAIILLNEAAAFQYAAPDMAAQAQEKIVVLADYLGRVIADASVLSTEAANRTQAL